MGWIKSLIGFVAAPFTGGASLLWSIATDIAISYVLNKFFGPDESQAQSQPDPGVKQRIPTSTKNKIPVVYGRKRVAGQIVYPAISSDNQKMAFIIVLSEGPISKCNTVQWDDKVLTFAGDVNTGLRNVTNAVDYDDKSHSFLNDGRCKVRVYPGGEPCSEMVSFDSSKWGSKTRPMTNLAYAYVEITYDAKERLTGLTNNLRFDLNGRLVKTITSGTALSTTESYSVNPAECLLDYMTNTTYGAGISIDEIDLLSFYAHKTFCATEVGQKVSAKALKTLEVDPSNGGNVGDSIIGLFGLFLGSSSAINTNLSSSLFSSSSITGLISLLSTAFSTGARAATLTVPSDLKLMVPRFTTNGVVNTNQDIDYNMTDLSAGNGSTITWTTGKFAIITDKATDSTASFSETNIVGDLDITGAGFNAKLNELILRFDAIQSREEEEQVELFTPESVKNVNEPRLNQQVRLPFTNNSVEATRLGTIQLNKSRQSLVAQFQVTIAEFGVTAGDVIKISHKTPGWVDKKFRVQTVKEVITSEGGIALDIVANEYAAEVYNESTLNESDPAPNTSFPDPYAKPTISGLAAVEDTTIELANLVLTWTSSNPFISDIEIGYRFLSQPDADLTTVVTSGTRAELPGLHINTAYHIEVTPITASGVRGTTLIAGATTGAARVVGQPGAAGDSYQTITIYRDATIAPANPNATNTALNGDLTAFTLNTESWTLSASSQVGSQKVYISSGIFKQTESVGDFVMDGVWSTVIQQSGQDGTDGKYRTYIYNQQVDGTTPQTPTGGGVDNFEEIVIPSVGWLVERPAELAGSNIWTSYGTTSVNTGPKIKKVAGLQLGGTTVGSDAATETFTGDGTTVDFTVTEDIASVTEITVDSAATTAFTFTGKVITFTTAPGDTLTVSVTYVIDNPTRDSLTLTLPGTRPTPYILWTFDDLPNYNYYSIDQRNDTPNDYLFKVSGGVTLGGITILTARYGTAGEPPTDEDGLRWDTTYKNLSVYLDTTSLPTTPAGYAVKISTILQSLVPSLDIPTLDDTSVFINLTPQGVFSTTGDTISYYPTDTNVTFKGVVDDGFDKITTTIVGADSDVTKTFEFASGISVIDALNAIRAEGFPGVTFAVPTTFGVSKFMNFTWDIADTILDVPQSNLTITAGNTGGDLVPVFGGVYNTTDGIGDYVTTDWLAPYVSTGTAGIDGFNKAIVNVYLRTDIPGIATGSFPEDTGQITFSTGEILFDDGTGAYTETTSGTGTTTWSTTIPTGTDQLYVRSASGVSREATTLVQYYQWSGAVESGSTGVDGQDGLNVATASYYQRTTSTSVPNGPTLATTLNFATGVLSATNNNSWQPLSSLTSTGRFLWITTATASSRTGTDIIATSEWSTAKLLSEDGANGAPGQTGINGASVLIVYSDDAAGTNQSLTQGSNKFVAYVEYTTTAPTLPLSSQAFIRFIGTDGSNGKSIFPIYATSAAGAGQTFVPSSNTGFVTFYESAATPTLPTTGQTFVKYIGVNGIAGSSVLIVYSNDAAGNNQSLTRGSREFIAYVEYTTTAPTLPLSSQTFVRFIGQTGGVGTTGDSIFPVYATSVGGANQTFTPSASTGFVTFYESNTTPTLPTTGQTFVEFIGTDGTNANGQNFIFRDSATEPSSPADSAGIPTDWLDLVPSSVTNKLWFCLGVQSNGAGNYVWGNVQPYGANGEDGTPGVRGSATYYLIIADRVTAATAGSTQFTADALEAIVEVLGTGSAPIENDRASIQYNLTDNTTKVVDGIYNGSEWIVFDQKIDGSLLVTGTVSADDIRGNTLTGTVIQTASSGKRFVLQAGVEEGKYIGASGNELITMGHTLNEESDNTVTSRLLSLRTEAVTDQPGSGLHIEMPDGGYEPTELTFALTSPKGGFVYYSSGNPSGNYYPFYPGDNTVGFAALYKFLGDYNTTLAAVPGIRVFSSSTTGQALTSGLNYSSMNLADTTFFVGGGGTFRIGGSGGEIHSYASVSSSNLNFDSAITFSQSYPIDTTVELIGVDTAGVPVSELPVGTTRGFVNLGTNDLRYDQVSTVSGVNYLKFGNGYEPYPVGAFSVGDPISGKRWFVLEPRSDGGTSINTTGVSIRATASDNTTGVSLTGVSNGIVIDKPSNVGLGIVTSGSGLGINTVVSGSGDGIVVSRFPSSGNGITVNNRSGDSYGIEVNNTLSSNGVIYPAGNSTGMHIATSKLAHAIDVGTFDVTADGSSTGIATITSQSYFTGVNCFEGRNRASGNAFYATQGGYGPFTGSHDALITETTENVLEPGDIVADTSEIYSEDTVSNIITKVEISDTVKDKKVLGIFTGTIISGTPSSDIGALTKEELQSLLDKGLKRTLINAVGEGKVNVCKEGGDIEIGDLIVSSSTPGKGMKQDDDLVRNCTVAKARESVTWSSDDDTIKQIGCTYLCG